MTARVFLNAERSAIVEEGSAEAAFSIHVKDAKKLGLLSDKAAAAAEAKPDVAEAPEADTEQAMADRTITSRKARK